LVDEAVPGLASESASARCVDVAASAKIAATVTPRQRMRLRPGSDIAMDKSSLTGDDALHPLRLAFVALLFGRTRS
jgi:hypothetical protein